MKGACVALVDLRPFFSKQKSSMLFGLGMDAGTPFIDGFSMALQEYQRKRSFKDTPEPTGGKPAGEKLQFVVQKHAASHLHYDFRLEIKGVLKSWAVPKGPSMDPAVKHLAMLVEDHPFDYKDFEGIIPKGQYGGGTVIVWDRGTYEPVEGAKSKKEQEYILMRDFFKGTLTFRLHGHKLKGIFALVKTPARGENAWLLVKQKDEFASTEDITLKDKSVMSRKTIEVMSQDKNARQWQSNRDVDWNVGHGAVGPVKAEKTPARKTAGKSAKTAKRGAVDNHLDAGIEEGRKSLMPTAIAPMLCTLTKTVINDPEYLYEIKWDGYRIIGYVQKKKVRLDSRSALDYTSRYPRIVQAMKDLGHDAVLDGEVVVFNEEGMPDFDALQLYNGHSTDIVYCVFDLLWLDGYDLKDLPLESRKALLTDLVSGNSVFRVSDSFDDGAALYEEMLNRNLEGVVAKHRSSPYVPGQRANEWLKTPTRKRQEFVIGGWAESDKSRAFRSLLFGAYNGKNLEWIGRSGGGYKEKEMPGILKTLEGLETDRSPFVNKVLDTKGAKIHWIKPKLVANFEFATWTKSGRIRKPATFLGFRQDKKPGQVVREVPKPITEVEEEVHDETSSPAKPPAGNTSIRKISSAKASVRKKQSRNSPETMAASNWPAVEAQPQEEHDTIDIGGCSVDLYNVDREIWKGIPKARLIEYYHNIAPFILPYLKDRPESLHVKMTSAGGPGLYIKDMEGRQPECAEVFTDTRRHPAKGKRNQIDYLVCNNESTLLWMINLGCIDINPWNSRTGAPDNPDYVVIDLDPTVKDEKAGYMDKLLDTALAAKAWCDKHKVKAFAKTSGKTGMHFYIPCAGIDYPQAREIAERICAAIHDLVPESSTTENGISQRGDLVYIDPSQNDYADTLAAPYSVRPFHIPTVSTPLEWKEINRRLNPQAFTIDTTLARLKKKGDVFAGVLDKKVAAANFKVLSKI
jgi:bifunctional non-homologous end joining protein LigD